MRRFFVFPRTDKVSLTECQAAEDAGTISELAQNGFEFGEVHFDGIEVGAGGRQVAYTRAADLDECFDCDDPVKRSFVVVEHGARFLKSQIQDMVERSGPCALTKEPGECLPSIKKSEIEVNL